jgi:hypothetical protein
MNKRKLIPALVVAATCAIGGAAAATTGALAERSTNHAPTTAHTTSWSNSSALDPHLAGLAGIIDQAADDLRGPVAHAQTVVPDGAGGVYAVTFDAGAIVGVSGNTITLEDGDGGNAYKKVDVVIPANAEISRDLQAVPLGDLVIGDHAIITRSDRGTQVVTFDDDHAPSFWPHP